MQAAASLPPTPSEVLASLLAGSSGAHAQQRPGMSSDGSTAMDDAAETLQQLQEEAGQAFVQQYRGVCVLLRAAVLDLQAAAAVPDRQAATAATATHAPQPPLEPGDPVSHLILDLSLDLDPDPDQAFLEPVDPDRASSSSSSSSPHAAPVPPPPPHLALLSAGMMLDLLAALLDPDPGPGCSAGPGPEPDPDPGKGARRRRRRGGLRQLCIQGCVGQVAGGQGQTPGMEKLLLLLASLVGMPFLAPLVALQPAPDAAAAAATARDVPQPAPELCPLVPRSCLLGLWRSARTLLSQPPHLRSLQELRQRLLQHLLASMRVRGSETSPAPAAARQRAALEPADLLAQQVPLSSSATATPPEPWAFEPLAALHLAVILADTLNPIPGLPADMSTLPLLTPALSSLHSALAPHELLLQLLAWACQQLQLSWLHAAAPALPPSPLPDDSPPTMFGDLFFLEDEPSGSEAGGRVVGSEADLASGGMPAPPLTPSAARACLTHLVQLLAPLLGHELMRQGCSGGAAGCSGLLPALLGLLADAGPALQLLLQPLEASMLEVVAAAPAARDELWRRAVQQAVASGGGPAGPRSLLALATRAALAACAGSGQQQQLAVGGGGCDAHAVALSAAMAAASCATALQQQEPLGAVLAEGCCPGALGADTVSVLLLLAGLCSRACHVALLVSWARYAAWLHAQVGLGRGQRVTAAAPSPGATAQGPPPVEALLLQLCHCLSVLRGLLASFEAVPPCVHAAVQGLLFGRYEPGTGPGPKAASACLPPPPLRLAVSPAGCPEAAEATWAGLGQQQRQQLMQLQHLEVLLLRSSQSLAAGSGSPPGSGSRSGSGSPPGSGSVSLDALEELCAPDALMPSVLNTLDSALSQAFGLHPALSQAFGLAGLRAPPWQQQQQKQQQGGGRGAVPPARAPLGLRAQLLQLCALQLPHQVCKELGQAAGREARTHPAGPSASASLLAGQRGDKEVEREVAEGGLPVLLAALRCFNLAGSSLAEGLWGAGGGAERAGWMRGQLGLNSCNHPAFWAEVAEVYCSCRAAGEAGWRGGGGGCSSMA